MNLRPEVYHRVMSLVDDIHNYQLSLNVDDQEYKNLQFAKDVLTCVSATVDIDYCEDHISDRTKKKANLIANIDDIEVI